MRLLSIIFVAAYSCLSVAPAAAQDTVLPTFETLQTVQSQFKTTLDEFPRTQKMAFVAAQDIEFFEKDVADSKITRRTATLFSEQARPGMESVDKSQRLEIVQWLQENSDHNGVLELYLNLAYFGRGAFGVEEASVAYFGKPAPEMQVQEAVYLALLLKAPKAMQGAENTDEIREHYNGVLDRMLTMELITQPDHAVFLAGPLPVVLPPTE